MRPCTRPTSSLTDQGLFLPIQDIPKAWRHMAGKWNDPGVWPHLTLCRVVPDGQSVNDAEMWTDSFIMWIFPPQRQEHFPSHFFGVYSRWIFSSLQYQLTQLCSGVAKKEEEEAIPKILVSVGRATAPRKLRPPPASSCADFGVHNSASGYGADGALHPPPRIETRAPGGVCAFRRSLGGRCCLSSTAFYYHYPRSGKVMEDGPLPDLRDIELKLGRKVPESLVRSLRGEEPVPLERDGDPCGGSGGGCSSSSSCSFPPSLSSSSASSPASGSPRRSHCSALERLETKLHFLRQEMVSAARQLREPGPGRKVGRSEGARSERAAEAAELRAGRVGNAGRRSAQAGRGASRGLFTPDFARPGFAKTAEAAWPCVLCDSTDSVLQTLTI